MRKYSHMSWTDTFEITFKRLRLMPISNKTSYRKLASVMISQSQDMVHWALPAESPKSKLKRIFSDSVFYCFGKYLNMYLQGETSTSLNGWSNCC